MVKEKKVLEIPDDLIDVDEESARMEMAERARMKKKLPKMPTSPEEEEVDEIEELRNKLAIAEAKKNQENFVKTAPLRLRGCEEGISENRNYLIKMNDMIKDLQSQFSLLVQKK